MWQHQISEAKELKQNIRVKYQSLQNPAKSESGHFPFKWAKNKYFTEQLSLANTYVASTLRSISRFVKKPPETSVFIFGCSETAIGTKEL